MLTWEFVLIVLTLIQPPIVGLLLLGLTRLSLISTAFGAFAKTTRRRLQSAKFFECAAHPRLLPAAHYDIVAISLCVVFVLYDVDLIFFFAEAVCFEGLSLFEGCFLSANVALLVAGLWYDNLVGGFNWAP